MSRDLDARKGFPWLIRCFGKKMDRDKKREEKKEKGRIRAEGIGSFQSIADMHGISGCTGQDNQLQGWNKTRQDKRVAEWIRIPMLHQLRGFLFVYGYCTPKPPELFTAEYDPLFPRFNRYPDSPMAVSHKRVREAYSSPVNPFFQLPDWPEVKKDLTFDHGLNKRRA